MGSISQNRMEQNRSGQNKLQMGKLTVPWVSRASLTIPKTVCLKKFSNLHFFYLFLSVL